MVTMPEPAPSASVTFIGHATTLLRLGDFTLLTDPVFGPAGSRVHLGYGLWTRRLADPAYPVDELPPLDAVLLSHLHGDHLDRSARRGLPADVPFVTTPQAARRLRRGRFARAAGLPTWEQREWSSGEQRLRVTAVPARHAPGPAHRLLPQLMGSVLELTVRGRCRLRVYVTGDTLFRPWLADIPRRCGDIDAMLIHVGGGRVLGILVSMDDRQGVDLTELIRPRLTLPLHDEYRVCRTPIPAFVRRARERGVAGVRQLGRGEEVPLPIRP